MPLLTFSSQQQYLLPLLFFYLLVPFYYFSAFSIAPSQVPFPSSIGLDPYQPTLNGDLLHSELEGC